MDLRIFLCFRLFAALDHAVADTDVRLDVLGMALVCLQFFSQGSHKDPQGGQLRGGAVGRAAPDLTDDVVVGQHFASVLSQQAQQFILNGRQVKLLPIEKCTSTSIPNS